MIIYNGTKSQFIKDFDDDLLIRTIRENLLKKLGRHTGTSELRSWQNSLPYMYVVLADKKIPDDAGIAIEYNIPHTSKRVDFIISGYDRDSKPAAVIIELKQWDKLKAVEDSALVETFTGGANRRVVHPSYQAWSYTALLNDYNQTVQDMGIRLLPCVFLHNYVLTDNDPVLSDQYREYLCEAPVFANGEQKKLRDYIMQITAGDNGQIIRHIDNGKIRPSKSLQNSIGKMITGNREFIMIDDQKVVYDKIREISVRCSKDNRKRTVIIEGGPGTGKSVVAVNLLAELTKYGQAVQYVSKNSAPRTVYQKKLQGVVTKSSIDNMFKGSGGFTRSTVNSIDTILVDEAHRLSAKSGVYQNYGENQIKEIIHAAKCSVFFIDEGQRVTISDIGSVDEIKKWAEAEHSEITMLELVSQFRCNGSDGYLSWVDNVLQIRETANFDLTGIDYDIKIFDDPGQLRAAVTEKNNAGQKSRILAGYCWDWIKNGKNDTNCFDITIGSFKISWNLGNSVYAIDDSSINEAGCIHTSQGLEFDYVGVIIGSDLGYKDGKVITDFNKRASTDQSLRGIKKMYYEDAAAASAKADELIKNTYRTLMTRGMKGCYIYCVDKGLSEYLKSKIKTEMGDQHDNKN